MHKEGKMKPWTVSNQENAKYIGLIEFQSNDGEFHNFEILLTKDGQRLVFGGSCNCGFIESGYMPVDSCFSIEENLQELIADLETYYNDGKAYTSGISCNERM